MPYFCMGLTYCSKVSGVELFAFEAVWQSMFVLSIYSRRDCICEAFSDTLPVHTMNEEFEKFLNFVGEGGHNTRKTPFSFLGLYGA